MDRPPLVHRRLGDTLVVVHLATDQIYELNSTAARIWELATAGKSASEIRRQLRHEFEAPEDSAAHEIGVAISWMQAEGLLRNDRTD